MFQSARLKLTLWYVIITMVVSFVFSLVLFSFLHRELVRSFRRRELRLQQYFDYTNPPPQPTTLNDKQIETAENLIKLQLFYANLIVLGLSALAGYFLAGRTLRPIKEMVDEQNRFVADASHEFRTPLTAMKTAIEVNLRDKNLTVNEAKSVLESNLSDVDSLKKLSDNLLALSHFQTNGSEVKMIKVSVKDVLNSSIEKVKYIARQKGISIEKEIKDTFILGDREKLIQLFVIFLDNAIKYSFKGGEIKISAENKDKNTVIKIEDRGVGINRKDIPFIFKSFYRGDKSRSKEFAEGYGLGLSIAKKLIDQHGGTVSVISSPNKGTTFTIQVPRILP